MRSPQGHSYITTQCNNDIKDEPVSASTGKIIVIIICFKRQGTTPEKTQHQKL